MPRKDPDLSFKGHDLPDGRREPDNKRLTGAQRFQNQQRDVAAPHSEVRHQADEAMHCTKILFCHDLARVMTLSPGRACEGWALETLDWRRELAPCLCALRGLYDSLAGREKHHVHFLQ